MNLRDLQYFATLAETKHFSKAAKLCFISQPTLSMQIRKLEEELGFNLIERQKKDFLLTQEGEWLLNKAKEILKLADEIKRYSREQKDPSQTSLHLALIPTIAPYLLPKILPNLKTKFDNLHLYLHEEKTETSLELLKQGKLDAAILALPLEADFLSTTLLYREKMLVALPANHPLNTHESISLQDIKKENLLLLAEGHCMRERVQDICHLAKHPADFSATSLETLRYMVASGIGITLLPEMAASENKLLTYKPFKNKEAYRDIVLAWRKSSLHSDLLQQIAKLICEKIEI